MGERSAGVTIAFALVSVVALAVSFTAARKMQHGQQQVDILKAEIDRRNETERALRTTLQETEQKYAQAMASSNDLKTALAQIQLKNEALAKETQQRRTKVAQNVETNFTSAKSSTPKKEQ